MPGTPWRRRKPSRLPVARQLLARRARSRHDHAPAVGPGRLRVGVVGAVVAYVGIGESDDLARVGGVGDHLLVPAHHRVEHDLAGGDLDVGSADGLALEHLPVT